MTDGRRAFLRELIDDAGLFPPASLPMEQALAQHAAARGGPHAFMLGRFICPADRLEELEEHLDLLPAWRLSVLVDGATPGAGLEAAERLTLAHEDVVVELVEAKPAGPDAIGGLVDAIDGAGLGAVAFLEVPPGEDAWLDAVAETAAGAKIRCGGERADLFPSPEEVAAFLDGCRRRGLRCKATAGLHHPFRHTDPETGFTHHGFVNLVAAAVLAREHDLDREAIERVVAEEEPHRFDLSADGLRWRDLRAGAAAIEDARRSVLFAYGSCSFAEPVEDLEAIGVLPL